jgi:hypothetical protein
MNKGMRLHMHRGGDVFFVSFSEFRSTILC